MSRRSLRFPPSQEGSHGERTPHITDFFKPVCKPDKNVFQEPGSNEDLDLQSQDVVLCVAEKSPPSKRLRRKSPVLTPSRSPVVEAALSRSPVVEAAPRRSPVMEAAPRRSPVMEAAPSRSPVMEATPSRSPVMEATPSRRIGDTGIVRNLRAFCAKCGMSLLSPKVVLERLTLPATPPARLGRETNKPTSPDQSWSSIKRRLRSHNKRSASASKMASWNKRRLRSFSGPRDVCPLQSFTLVGRDSCLSHNIYPQAIGEKKSTHQAFSLRNTRSHGMALKVTGTPEARGPSSQDSSDLEDNEDGLSPDVSPLESRKKRARRSRDSVDSDDTFTGFSLSSDEEEHEETLKPLDEILQMADHPVPATPQRVDTSSLSLSQTSLTDTPEMGTFQQLPKTPRYDNTLERLVREKAESDRIDAIEKQLHEEIEKGLGVADVDMMESEEEGELPDEFKDILKKFSVNTSAIPDNHPGEEIFHLSESGAIFTHSTLNLKNLEISADFPEERIIFSCSPENQLELATEGMLTTIYRFRKCPEVLMRWMFQVASVHPSYITSVKLLNTLIEMTCNCLTNLDERPWTPTLLDIATVFCNMGVPFTTLFPLANILPSFSASDLASAVPGSGSSEQIFSRVPEFHIAHVVKFVGLCAATYRETFPDLEILALLVMLLKVYLEKELRNVPVMDFHCLIANLLQCIKEWPSIMPELCFAVSQLTGHHHNFIRLLHLIPTFESRGREVRRHVSLILLSDLLYGGCTEFPLDYESQMEFLCRCMSRMKPSSLAKKIQKITQNDPKTALDLDQEAYYLSYSLLHFLSDASSSDEPPSTQRKHLQILCTELEKYIKSDIREDARFFYRTKVKDLVARIHGRWQELLLYSRPDQGKLHDYWQPVCDGSSPQSSQEHAELSQENPFIDQQEEEDPEDPSDVSPD